MWSMRPSLPMSQRPCFRSQCHIVRGMSTKTTTLPAPLVGVLRSSLRRPSCSRPAGAPTIGLGSTTVRPRDSVAAPHAVQPFVQRNKTDRTDPQRLLEANHLTDWIDAKTDRCER